MGVTSYMHNCYKSRGVIFQSSEWYSVVLSGRVVGFHMIKYRPKGRPPCIPNWAFAIDSAVKPVGIQLRTSRDDGLDDREAVHMAHIRGGKLSP